MLRLWRKEAKRKSRREKEVGRKRRRKKCRKKGGDGDGGREEEEEEEADDEKENGIPYWKVDRRLGLKKMRAPSMVQAGNRREGFPAKRRKRRRRWSRDLERRR